MAGRLTLLVATLLCFGAADVKARTVCSNATTVDRNLGLLLAEYERQEQPADAQVLLSLSVRYATLLERSGGTLRLLADLHMTWQDDRLAWNSADWDCDVAYAEAEQIWLPDIVTLTSGASSGATGDPQRVQLNASGAVAWVMHLDLTAPCEVDLASWPRDTQTCTIRFGPRFFNSYVLNITLNNDDTDPGNSESGRPWELLALSGSVMDFSVYDDDITTFVEWSLTLKRRAPAHVLACHAIATAIVLQMLAAGILPSKSRPPLCAFAALSAMFWMFTILARVPGAATTPSPLSLTSGMLVLACVAALAAALVQRIARLTTPPSHAARRLVAATQTYISPPERVTEGAVSTWLGVAELVDAVLLLAIGVVLVTLLAVYS